MFVIYHLVELLKKKKSCKCYYINNILFNQKRPT